MGTARACNMAKSLPVIGLLFVAALALAAPTPTKNIVPTNEAFTSNSSNQDFPPCHFVAVSPCPAREPSSCYLGYMTAEGSTGQRCLVAKRGGGNATFGGQPGNCVSAGFDLCCEYKESGPNWIQVWVSKDSIDSCEGSGERSCPDPNLKEVTSETGSAEKNVVNS